MIEFHFKKGWGGIGFFGDFRLKKKSKNSYAKNSFVGPRGMGPHGGPHGGPRGMGHHGGPRGMGLKDPGPRDPRANGPGANGPQGQWTRGLWTRGPGGPRGPRDLFQLF